MQTGLTLCHHTSRITDFLTTGPCRARLPYAVLHCNAAATVMTPRWLTSHLPDSLELELTPTKTLHLSNFGYIVSPHML